MGWDSSFRQSFFVHEQQVERKKESLGWRNHGGRMMEHLCSVLEMKNEDQVVSP
jgi:hypothetical protein